MPSRLFAGVLAAACVAVASAGPAQPPAKAPPDPPPPSPTDFTVKLNDESQFSVVLLDPAVTIVTKYGKLVVPAAEIRKIEPGFRYPIGAEQKVNKAVEDLGAPEYKAREEAESALVGFGVAAVPAVRRAAKSEDPEVARRAGAVLKNLAAKLPADKMEVRDHDLVETAEFTARGRIEGTQLKVKTKHFGESSIPLADMRTFASAVRGGPTEFALDAAQYGKQNQSVWMETSVELTDGQQVEITANGQIDLWPQQPGQYLGTPSGQMTVNGGIQPFRGAGAGGTPGQVLGRIGPNGVQFVVGAAYKGRVSGTGKLHLRIVGSPWSNDCAGNYTMKVIAGGR